MLKRMLHLDETHDRMKEGLTKSLKTNMNVVGSRRSLELTNVEFVGAKSSDDFKGQLRARDARGNYAQVIKGTFNLKDNVTGKTIAKKKINIGHLPVLTKRLSYLVGGREYQVQSQFRRRSGVYTRIADNGELQAVAANDRKGQLKMVFDPNSRLITIQPVQRSHLLTKI